MSHFTLAVVRNFGVAVAMSMPFLAFGLAGPAYSGDTPEQDLAAQRSIESSFFAENDAAMNKMLADMAIKPTGDVDRDFVSMMVPHHQGAIGIARAELKYGRNELLRNLARAIVDARPKEITEMRLAIGEGDPVSHLAPGDTLKMSMSPDGAHDE